MRRADVTVQLREKTGKGAARTARSNGDVPAVVYGGGESPVSIAVNRKEIEKTLYGGESGSDNVLINLKIEGGDSNVLTLVRDMQNHPIKDVIEHIDFYRVSLDKTITTTIPVNPQGTPKGVRDGGNFELILREIEIECLPMDIPDGLVIDVAALELGDSIHIRDIPEPEKYTILTDPIRTICTVTAQVIEKEPVEEEAVEGEVEDQDKEKEVED